VISQIWRLFRQKRKEKERPNLVNLVQFNFFSFQKDTKKFTKIVEKENQVMSG
jgi:hypothetical protein